MKRIVKTTKKSLAYVYLRDVIDDVVNKGLFKQASAMAYTTLLSIVPSLAVSFSLLSLMTPIDIRAENLHDIKMWVLSKLTEGTGQEVADRLEFFIETLDISQLGWTSFLGLLLTLTWLLRQIELTFNEIWEIKKNRNIVVRLVYFIVIIVSSVLSASFLLKIIQTIGLGELFSPGRQSEGLLRQLWDIPLSLIASFAFFFALFKLVPNTKVRFLATVVGASFSAVSFQATKFLFVFYVRHIADYQVIYGALAALPLFLLWLYLCWLTTLIGAVVCWRVQKIMNS